MYLPRGFNLLPHFPDKSKVIEVVWRNWFLVTIALT